MAADASDYPTSADSISRTSPSDNLTGHSDLHDKMADAIEEIQGFVGVSGDTTAGTVVKRITDLEGTDITVTFGTGSDLSGSFTITNLGNVTNTTVSVRDDSHNHIISNVDGLQTALDAKLTSSSSLNADNIDSGTIADARIPSGITRDSEVSGSTWKLYGFSSSTSARNPYSYYTIWVTSTQPTATARNGDIWIDI